MWSRHPCVNPRREKIFTVILSYTVIEVDAAAELDSTSDMDEGLYPALGGRVARLRKELDITQEALGGRAGMSRATIASIEAGRQRVTLDQLYQLASALELDDLSQLIPLEVTRYQPIAAGLDPDLNPIQVAQIETILRSALARAHATRKRP